MTRMIIRSAPSRVHLRPPLRQKLPTAEWVTDLSKPAQKLSSHQRASLAMWDALVLAGSEPCVHLEDDAVLCPNFLPRLQARITDQPHVVQQFFSMRQKDVSVGSRWDNTFHVGLCFYLPAGHGLDLLEWWHQWPFWEKHPGGYAYMIGDWLKGRREKYWINVPSLVQHLGIVSTIDKRRSKFRQSPTFKDTYADISG
jgi:hypothetical protein